jgi:hypothetical protein
VGRSRSKNKIIKSISFNITNENDRATLELIKNMRSFSGYVKKLIERDIAQGNLLIQDEFKDVFNDEKTLLLIDENGCQYEMVIKKKDLF